jgi:N-acetylmuramoyl-L-alanine amidase
MRVSFVNTIRLLFLCGFAAWVHPAFGVDWKLYRFEGRDYVSLDDMATFYGLPTPPVIDNAPAAKPSPEPAAKPAPGAQPTEVEVGPAIPTSPAGAAIKLESAKYELALAPGTREAEINGVKQWLAFPTHVEDGKLLLSRIDLSKIVEPRLRPEKVEGLHPVTTVVLDPGHGGHDNGATSRYGFEKNFALDVALRARTLLEQRRIKVLMTRSADIFIPLQQRPAVANQIKDSIFVSIHFNSASSNSEARGFEIYSLAPRGAPATNDGGFRPRDLVEEPGNVVDTQSAVLAGAVYHSLLGNVPMEDRGLKQARFAVLRLCTQPAVLVECGFVSNSSDSSLAGTPAWRQKLAEAIVTGIEAYKDLAEQKIMPKMMADYRKANESPQ